MKTNAVTFGRFNLPHPGHVDLVRKMLTVADTAYVAVSTGKNNNDIAARIYVFDRLCVLAGLDMSRVVFIEAKNPFDAVEAVLEINSIGQVDPEVQKRTTVVLGIDQTQLGERLRDNLGVAFVPNEVRIGSSTVIRYFLETGEEQFVREIYHEDEDLFSVVLTLRSEELRRDEKL